MQKKEKRMKNRDEKNFISIANEIGELVQEKNIAYGDSFAKSQEIVKVLYPDGVRSAQYTDMLAIVRVIDKLFRIATKKDAFGESPWRDICGYAILGIANDEEEAKAKPIKTNAELWEEQNETLPQGKVYYTREAWAKQQQEEAPIMALQDVIKESILQSVRDKREEGHGNPYANIDANAEGHKEKGCKDEDKENKAVVSFDEWNRYVSSSSEKEKS
jgi:hypothetical protein